MKPCGIPLSEEQRAHLVKKLVLTNSKMKLDVDKLLKEAQINSMKSDH